MRKFVLLKYTLPLFLLLISSFPSQAAAKTNLVFIFDASGSMWGQIDGKPKIAIAKEAMDLIVNDLPGDMNVGLVAYGHRRKGDCDDVETLIPLGPLDAKTFLDKVNALNPKGKTPMVRSIRKTADDIRHLEDETTILLVSDGEETCDPDPCGFVAELEKLGIKFVLHVVGFDVGGKTEEQLKCMAKAGGGEYFPAKDAGKLKDALSTVIKKTVEKNLKVSIFLNGKPIGGSVAVADAATGESAGSRSSSAPHPILMGVAPGTYTVTVVDEWKQEGRPSLVFENVQVTEDQVREITANFGSGTLDIWTIRNGQPFKGRARVSTLDDQTVGGGYATTFPDKPAQYMLPPGQYKVMAEDSWGAGTQKDLGIIEIVAGQTIEKKVSFDTGKLVIWTFLNGKPFKGRARVSTLDDQTVGGGYATTFPDKPAEYLLEPGKYKVMAEDSWGAGTQRDLGIIEIVAGQTIEKKASFDTGKLVVWTHRNGKPFHASVRVADMNDQTMGGGWGTTYEDRPETYTLEPGTYKLDAEDSWGDPVVALKFGSVEIKAGQTLNKICDFDSPPPQDQSPPTSAPAPSTPAPGAEPVGAVSPDPNAAQTAADGPPKQTGRETVEQASPAATAPVNPQDMQAMAEQMQAAAQAQAAQAQADAMAQMQAALAGMQGNQLPQSPQTPAQQAAASGAAARETGENSQGAAQVGAQDTGGGLSEADERPEQGVNPYEGMSEQEMQAAFARDMGMQGPQGVAYDKTDWQLGKTYPLDCKRFEDTLNNRLNGYTEQAEGMGRPDILQRIKTARANLDKLARQRKQRVSKEVLQQTLDQCVQEIHAINVTIAQAQ